MDGLVACNLGLVKSASPDDLSSASLLKYQFKLSSGTIFKYISQMCLVLTYFIYLIQIDMQDIYTYNSNL